MGKPLVGGIYRLSSLFSSTNQGARYKKIASLSGIDAASVATVTLTFEAGCTLYNSVPTHTVVTRLTGTVNGQIARVTDSATNLTAATTLTTLAATNDRFLIQHNPVAIKSTGNLSFQTTVGSSAPATIKVEVFGINY